MKILLVNKFYYLKGGSEKYMFTIADSFKKMGHEVIFFCMQDEKNFDCSTKDFFVSHRSKDESFFKKMKYLSNIIYSQEAYNNMFALMKKENPDLVILNLVHKQLTCSVIDAIREAKPKVPIFWTVHDLIHICPSYTMLNGKGEICEKCLTGNFKNCFKNKCCHSSAIMSFISMLEAYKIKKNRWYDEIDLYICPSMFYKNKLEEAHFTKSKIMCMRNPLPIESEYSLNYNDSGYVLYFGRLSKEKGVKTLIMAVKTVNCKLFIVGTGPLESELKKYVEDNKINNVEFKGFQTGESLNKLIKESRCVILPSEWYENGPYSAMEAMALGKPLIVSNNGGLPELVEGNGFIFKNQDELTFYLKRMMDMDVLEYKTMCTKSLNLAKKLFDARAYVDFIVDEVNKIV